MTIVLKGLAHRKEFVLLAFWAFDVGLLHVSGFVGHHGSRRGQWKESFTLLQTGSRASQDIPKNPVMYFHQVGPTPKSAHKVPKRHTYEGYFLGNSHLSTSPKCMCIVHITKWGVDWTALHRQSSPNTAGSSQIQWAIMFPELGKQNKTKQNGIKKNPRHLINVLWVNGEWGVGWEAEHCRGNVSLWSSSHRNKC